MDNFTNLFHELDSTNSNNAKVRSLVKYFETVEREDALWMVSLFIGKRPKRTITLSLLREWTAEISEIPYWLFEESYHVIGDLAETIAILLPEPNKAENYTLTGIITKIKALGDLEVSEKKSHVFDLWNSLSRESRFLFNKILTGGFRVGVSKKTIVKALSQHLNETEATISHRLMGNWTPETISFNDLLVAPNESERLSKPYPFYLAYALEVEPHNLGPTNEWSAEYKWDGIRGQLIKRDGNIFIWTRGEELVSDRYPEYHVLSEVQEDHFVLDGEIMAWKDGKPLPFSDLQKRLNRKTVGKKLLSDVPVKFIAYDVFEYEGKDIRGYTYEHRRKILEKIIMPLSADMPFQISETLSYENWKELEDLRINARAIGAEGLMIKHNYSTYKAGRKKGDWWKWKVDPFSIDAILLYAMRGHGRRSNLFSDFTFAVRHEGSLVPFAKAYSGLTDQELTEVTNFVKKNTIETFGPVRSVAPHLVFEISFEGISKSTRHKSGIAVRFPRITQWRKDKSPDDINTLGDLKAMLDLYG